MPHKIAKCSICQKEMFKRFIKCHEENHSREFKCEHCLKIFGSKNNMQKHIDTIHKKLRKHVCNICGKSFTDPTPLKQHTQRHNADPKVRPFKCKLCEKDFMLQVHLRAHELGAHESENVKCDFCNKELGKKSIKAHISSFHSDFQLECPICQQKFTRERLMTMHIQVAHNPNKKREFKCKECDKAYTTTDYLRKHIRYQHKKSEVGKWVCKICDISYAQSGGLYIHNQSKHGPKLFKCVECDQMFSKKVILTRHTMSQHTKIKPFQCKECDLSFFFPSQLKDHQNTHSGLRPYKCEPCDKSFTSKRSLQIHHKSKFHQLVLKLE